MPANLPMRPCSDVADSASASVVFAYVSASHGTGIIVTCRGWPDANDAVDGCGRTLWPGTGSAGEGVESSGEPVPAWPSARRNESESLKNCTIVVLSIQ